MRGEQAQFDVVSAFHQTFFSVTGAGGGTSLTLADAQAIAELPEVVDVAPSVRDSAQVRYRGANFEARLEVVTQSLATVVPPVPVKKAALTFRGAPVIGSRAIAADFTAKVTTLFNDAVTAIAAGLQDNLKS